MGDFNKVRRRREIFIKLLASIRYGFAVVAIYREVRERGKKLNKCFII
jgi:hypothetical protein